MPLLQSSCRMTGESPSLSPPALRTLPLLRHLRAMQSGFNAILEPLSWVNGKKGEESLHATAYFHGRYSLCIRDLSHGFSSTCHRALADEPCQVSGPRHSSA
jgi:hypothetical protein